MHAIDRVSGDRAFVPYIAPLRAISEPVGNITYAQLHWNDSELYYNWKKSNKKWCILGNLLNGLPVLDQALAQLNLTKDKTQAPNESDPIFQSISIYLAHMSVVREQCCDLDHE